MSAIRRAVGPVPASASVPVGGAVVVRVLQQHRIQGAQESAHVAFGGAGVEADHADPGARHADREGAEHPFVGERHPGEHDDRMVDAELRGGRRAPDEWP